MTQIPIQKETIDRIAAANKIQNPGKASIREMRKMIQDVEKETGVRFVKMEMGIPGLPAPKVGVEAQIEALRNGDKGGLGNLKAVVSSNGALHVLRSLDGSIALLQAGLDTGHFEAATPVMVLVGTEVASIESLCK